MKLNNKLQLTAFFMSMLMLNACGGGGNDSTPNPAAVAPPTTTPVTSPVTRPVTRPVTPPTVINNVSPLDGSWLTSCRQSSELNRYDEQETLTFKGSTLTTTTILYSTSSKTCKPDDEVLRVRVDAYFVMGTTVNPGSTTEHTNIDITNTKAMLVPMDNTLQVLLNNTGHTYQQSKYNGFGLTSWGNSYWKDVTNLPNGKTAFKIDQPVADIFQITTVQNNGSPRKILKLGIKGGNVDGSGRPISLADSITATLKQTTQQLGNSIPAGTWVYPCQLSKGHDNYRELKTLTVRSNNTLLTEIRFYPKSSTNCTATIAFEARINAELKYGKSITGNQFQFKEIGIKTTKVEMRVRTQAEINEFNGQNVYNTPATYIYYGYGATNWTYDSWKDISDMTYAITNFNIGTEIPDIYQINTERINNVNRSVLQMGDYKSLLDIYGRPMAVEAQGALLRSTSVR